MIANHRCVLCDPRLGPILAEGTYWRLVLNRNQDLLGKCFLTLRRHCESIVDVTPEEWTELQDQVRVATRALWEVFHPDHFNYAFLQNQDRHVHLHVIPRYAALRDFAGEVFTDPGFPDHYVVGGSLRLLAKRQVAQIAQTLRTAAVQARKVEITDNPLFV